MHLHGREGKKDKVVFKMKLGMDLWCVTESLQSVLDKICGGDRIFKNNFKI